MLAVSVRPHASGLLNNRLFDGSPYRHFGDASHWMEPFHVLREEGLRRGIDFVTEDLLPLDRAAVFLMMEMPQTPAVVRKIREAHPRLPIAMQIFEAPLGRQWVFDPANHTLFDAVLTYNDKLRGREKYFIFRFPAGGLDGWSPPASEMPWADRKTVCQVSNVPNVSPLLPRRTGLGVMRYGWHFNLSTWWNHITEQGSLYRRRLEMATALSEVCPGGFDLFGAGWPDLPSEAIRRSARGVWPASNLDLFGRYRFSIAWENSLNDSGYTSEKIFDAFLGGTVPVYLGNTRIQESVPRASFIDARDFRSPADLARHLNHVSQADWEAMRQAGRDYLAHGAAAAYGSMQYVDSVVGAVRYAASRSNR